MFYTTADIVEAYTQLGIRKGDLVYLTGNLGNLGFHESKTKQGTLSAHHEAINSVIGNTGTIVVPTHSFNLCNTDVPFQPNITPSQRGPFTEYIRQQPGAVRQLHPFASLTALGPRAEEICGNTSRHAYGPNTPFERLLQADAWGISIAMPPQVTCSIIHHMEMTMAVPYRYTKEFLHPIEVNGQISMEPFYLFVTYQKVELERDRNEKFFQHPILQQHVHQQPVGIGHIWAYKMRHFEQATRDCLTKDIYAWLRTPPQQRPFRN
jgi:aminoglycoside 3-N-acetyltransferase